MKQLIIIIDALGHSLITEKRTPELFSIFQQDYFQSLKTLLGYSNAIFPSIFSGKYPNQHNIWALYKISPKTSPFKQTKFYPSFIFDRTLFTRYFANTMIVHKSKKLGLLPKTFVPPNIPIKILHHFDISMKKHIFEPGSMGETVTLFDLFRKNDLKFKYVGYPWNKGNKEILSLAEKYLQNNPIVVAYLDAIDHDGHVYGVNSNEFRQHMIEFDELFSAFLKRILKSEDVCITIFSDHGMKNIDGNVDVKSPVDSTGLKLEKDFIPFLDSTMARFLVFNNNAKELLTDTLEGIRGGRLLTPEELIKYKINFKSREYGDLIFLADTGKLIQPNFYTVLGRAGKGMHGWDPEDKSQDSFLFCNKKFPNDERIDVTKIFYILRQFLKI